MAIIISRVRLRWVKKENRQQFHLHNLFSFGALRSCMRRSATDKGRTAFQTVAARAQPTTVSIQSFCLGFFVGISACAVSFIFWVFTI